MTSSAATKSVNTASTWSSPAITFMISELGFVYFFGRTEARKAVMVYSISLVSSMKGRHSYIKSMRICWSTSCFDASYCSGKQLPCLCLVPVNVPSHLVYFQPRTCRWTRSSGLNSLRIFCNVALSGFRRKNSLQYPSDFSLYSSSWRKLSRVPAISERYRP